jgi:hypothetical protein
MGWMLRNAFADYAQKIPIRTLPGFMVKFGAFRSFPEVGHLQHRRQICR